MNTKSLPPEEDGPTNPEPQEANGLPQPRAAAESARAALSLASERKSRISEDQSETLTSIFDTAQPRGSYSERMGDRERRINEDASFQPLRAPHKRPDGKYTRPRGRAPQGTDWDSDRGVYVPRKGRCWVAKPRQQKHKSSGSRASDGDITGASSGNPYARPRLQSFGASARAASRERRSSYADMPSSTGSFAATSASETDPDSGKRKRTRSRGFGRESSEGEGESDGKNGVRHGS